MSIFLNSYDLILAKLRNSSKKLFNVSISSFIISKNPFKLEIDHKNVEKLYVPDPLLNSDKFTLIETEKIFIITSPNLVI